MEEFKKDPNDTYDGSVRIRTNNEKKIKKSFKLKEKAKKKN